ncbi:iron-sulfur cluster biosynthesis family protein [Paenibacillus sp.]|uniref:iron-sulfur cluster biosynthesis family protein n=1 Tax=Paenibacillus sp. TaxID=58172 RepID=UPI002D6053B4|nr:iron-sulfur cluster biosynthesis family protein [Paenibacillus sp.]HZG85380.1 iron-sulfur cluster biosynthesis family protein [Paenibacillus sp.]
MINISMTPAAVERLASYERQPGDRIRLVYDSEGCGCAVSGVASLWLTNAAEPDELEAETNAPALPVTYLKRQEVFFEDNLRLDYSPERRTFRLSSDGQIYGNGIVVSDRRGASRATEGALR